MRIFYKPVVFIVVFLTFFILLPESPRAQPWLSEEERLSRGDVIISLKEAPESRVLEVQGEILYNAPLELVWSVFTDYSSYARIFPDMEVSQVLERRGNVVRVKIRINNLWPNPDFEYIIKITENRPAKSISWIMEEGNLKTLYGSCALQILVLDKEQKTKVIYTMDRDSGWFVPSLNAALANRSVVIERLLAQRKEIRIKKRFMEGINEDPNIKPKWRKALFWWEKAGQDKDINPIDKKPKPSPEKNEKKDK